MIVRRIVKRRRGDGRLFALLLAAATLVIAGLLGMHSLANPAHGTGAGTGSTMVVAASHVSNAAAVSHAAGDDAATAGAPCPTCAHPAGAPDHAMLMLACVMATATVVVGLFAPPRSGRLVALPNAPARPLARAAFASALAALPPPRTPSLTVLSISRT